MKKIAALLFVVIIISACAAPQTLGQAKENLTCIEYKEGMDWQAVAGAFGRPNGAPLPQAGTKLSENTRIYRSMSVIFYTKSQEFREEGKLRFKEVVYKIEVCK